MTEFKIGSKVQWKWLGRPIRGQVKKIFFKKVSREIKGKQITRNGSANNPAYLVVSDAGNESLKLQTELSRVATKKTGQRPPTMFS